MSRTAAALFGAVWALASCAGTSPPPSTPHATSPEDTAAPPGEGSGSGPLVVGLGHRGDIMAIAWSPRGDLIATLDDERIAEVRDARTGAVLGVMIPGPLRGSAPMAIRFDAAGDVIIAGNMEWDLRDDSRRTLTIPAG